MPNIELLQKTLAKVQEEAAKPDNGLWYQAYWHHDTDCGTAYCFGGWAVTLSGYDTLGSCLSSGQGDPPLRQGAHINDAACFLLDIEEEVAEVLFDGQNTLERIEDVVSNLVEGRDPRHGLKLWSYYSAEERERRIRVNGEKKEVVEGGTE